MRTYIPSTSRISRIRRIMRCLAGGSRPFVGSSRSGSRGPWAMAWASFASCFMAELAVAGLAEAHGEESLVGALERPLGRQARQLRHVPDEAHAAHV